MFKRQPISFNLGDPHQKKLYEYCKSQSNNFSGFVKNVLFLYMNGQIEVKEPEREELDVAFQQVEEQDHDFISDIL